MAAPIEQVFRRGAIFLWKAYEKLDDPNYQGRTKPKFIVMLSGSPNDDPLYYLLTTSIKPPANNHPRPQHLYEIPANTYCFNVDTLIDVEQFGDLDIDATEFKALYAKGAIEHKGVMTAKEVESLVAAIKACPVVLK